MNGRERTQIFLTVGEMPKVIEGQLNSAQEGVFVVLVEGEEEALSGNAVLHFPDSARERVLTTIEGMDGGLITFRETRRVAPDKRNYPRLYAGLCVTYMAADAAAGTRWIESGEAPDGVWMATDEFMNFSVSGLAFEGTGAVPKGGLVLLKIAPGGSKQAWHGTGNVVRCDTLEEAEWGVLENDAVTKHSLAVSFVDIPHECIAALEELTIKLLDV